MPSPTESPNRNDGLAEGVVRSTLTMSMATLLSRITGFARTWAMAFALGNTLLASSFNIANNVPNMLYELVAGGMLTTAFLPIYVTYLETKGKRDAGDFAGNLMGIALVVLGLISLLGSVFAPQIIATQTFMSSPEEAEQAVFFFRFFSFEVVAYGAGAIISGVLNSHKSFLWPSMGPVFNNVVVVAVMVAYVFISPSNPGLAMVVLAVGTVGGVVAMYAVQLPALIRLGVPIRIHIDLHDPALIKAVRIALPATIFVVVNLVVVSIRNAFSMGVSDNGPATLSYAWLWYQFPYGVIAVALSTAMFTEMSASAANKDWPLFRRNVRGGLSGTLFLILPLATLMLVLAVPLTSIYHAGAFTEDDVQVVAQVLRCWCVSLPFYAGYMFLYRTFSATKDLGRVTWADAIGRVVQSALYALLTMGIGGWEGIGIVGIPIADAIFYIAMFFVLCMMLRKKVGDYGLSGVLGSAGRSLAASLVAGAVCAAGLALVGTSTSIAVSVAQVICLGAVGLVVFYALAKLMRVGESEIVDKLLRRVAGKLRRRA